MSVISATARQVAESENAFRFCLVVPVSELFAAQDNIVREAGGRIYPAQDAHISAANLRAA